jgi:hypothetical protein
MPPRAQHTVADDPDLLAHWDHERNTVDPATLSAIAARPLWWVCATDPVHRWQVAPGTAAAWPGPGRSVAPDPQRHTDHGRGAPRLECQTRVGLPGRTGLPVFVSLIGEMESPVDGRYLMSVRRLVLLSGHNGSEQPRGGGWGSQPQSSRGVRATPGTLSRAA